MQVPQFISYYSGSQPTGCDPKLGRLKILSGRSFFVFFCKHAQRVTLVERNNTVNATPFHSSNPFWIFVNKKLPSFGLNSGDRKVVNRYEVGSERFRS